MANLPTALAKIICALSKSEAGVPMPESSLRAALHALDSLNSSSSAQTDLLMAINDAERVGDLHIEGVPITILRGILATAVSVEACNG
jgi:hypothetical protein